MMTLPEGLVRREGKAGVAYFSQDGLYRYALERRWGEARFGRFLGPGPVPGEEAARRTILWIMLNPSVADHERDDLTIKKCIGFSKAWEAVALRVVNIFAYISTDPKELLSWGDPEGSLNQLVLAAAGQDCDKVICAWGGLPRQLARQSWPMRQRLKELYTDKMQCLGRTADGYWPRHPSRIGYKTALESWS